MLEETALWWDVCVCWAFLYYMHVERVPIASVTSSATHYGGFGKQFPLDSDAHKGLCLVINWILSLHQITVAAKGRAAFLLATCRFSTLCSRAAPRRMRLYFNQNLQSATHSRSSSAAAAAADPRKRSACAPCCIAEYFEFWSIRATTSSRVFFSAAC